MSRIALVFGSIAGLVVIGTTMVGYELLGPAALAGLEWLGYLVMFAALSLIFVGVKRYRDEELGGAIRFGTALRVGLAIALVASVVYIAAWEAYGAMTGYAFTEDYAASYVADIEASGAGEAEVEEARQAVAVAVERMANPAFRLFVSFIEIFPVGLLMALFSAAVLRRSDVGSA